MPYEGQSPRDIDATEFSERDRSLGNALVADAEAGRAISAVGFSRLVDLEAHGSSVQAAYFLQRIGSVPTAHLAFDLPRDTSNLIAKDAYDRVQGKLWKVQGLAQADNK